MKIVLNIGIIFLRIIYFFYKFLPTKNKITMISRQSNKPSINFKLLAKEIEKQGNFEVVILAHKLEPGIKKKIEYIFHMFKQMYHIATSKVVILDTYCICISLLNHKKNLIVIQMWHAMGALKKFGYSVLDTDSTTSALGKKLTINEKKDLSKIMKMHKGYNYIFASSKACVPYYVDAFKYEAKDIVVMSPPIVDILMDNKYQKNKEIEIKDTYPIMKKKKNIIYVPTFRKEESSHKIQELIDSVNFKKYNLIIKTHPLTKLDYYDERVIWDDKFTSMDLMIASDYIISDYSAIVFEASLLNKPIYFYIYDFDEYTKYREFYIDYKKEMPGKMSSKSKEIIKWIENNDYDLNKIKVFSKKYIYFRKNTTKKIVDFIMKKTEN